MKGKCVRVNISLNSKEQHLEWEEFREKNGYSNLSHMIRIAVNKLMLGEESPLERVMEPLKNAVSAVYDMVDRNRETLGFVNMKLDNSDEASPDVIKEAKIILGLLRQGEKSRAEIEGRLKLNRDVVSAALVLIYRLGLIGTHRGNKEKQ